MAASDTIVGLDVGQHSVKAVWVQSRGSRPTVLRTEVLHLPLGDSNPMRIVAPWIEQCGISKHRCAMGVPASDCVFQTFAPQKDDPRPLAAIVAMEVAKFNDIASTDMSFGWREWTASGEHRVLVAMAKPTQVDHGLEFGRLRGIRTVELMPTVSGVHAAVAAYCSSQPGTTAVVDIGHTATSITFCGEGGLVFARSFRTGGAAFSEALRSGQGLSSVQADTFKMTKCSMDSEDAQIRERLEQAAKLWCGEVESCMSGFRSHFPGEPFRPARLVVCGGGSLLGGLTAALSGRLGLPLVPLATATGGALQERQAGFVVALGMALAAHQPGDVVSLLPEYVRDELVFRDKKKLWISSGIILALALGVFSMSIVRAYRQEARRLADAKKAVQELTQLRQKIDAGEARIADLQARTEPLMDLLTWGPRCRELVTLTAESLAMEDWVSLLCDTNSYEAVPLFDETPEDHTKRGNSQAGGLRDKRLLVARSRDKGHSDAPRPLPKVFVIEGYTRDLRLSSVRELARQLEARRDLVVTADLLWDDMVQPPDWFRRYTAGKSYKRFSLEVTMRDQP